jgi:hypothetical protein
MVNTQHIRAVLLAKSCEEGNTLRRSEARRAPVEISKVRFAGNWGLLPTVRNWPSAAPRV